MLTSAYQLLPLGMLDTPDLHLVWSEVPWDTAILGRPVVQITHLEVRGVGAARSFMAFEAERDKLRASLVSCRLPHDALRESMLLEQHGFRFVEMVYYPELARPAAGAAVAGLLTVCPAADEDLPVLLDAAGQGFRLQRFQMDPRLDPALGDERYRNWVRAARDHPTQRLEVLRDGDRVVAFFITESLPDGTCYWHLNGVVPAAQGGGYGRRAWETMLARAWEAGAQRVRTCISARNHRVLNLYARLGFYFPAPAMTLHWVPEIN